MFSIVDESRRERPQIHGIFDLDFETIEGIKSNRSHSRERVRLKMGHFFKDCDHSRNPNKQRNKTFFCEDCDIFCEDCDHGRSLNKENCDNGRSLNKDSET